MKKFKILKKDFDAAVKQPWSTNTCLIAQADKRANGGTSVLSRMAIQSSNHLAKDAMIKFDSFFLIGRGADKMLGAELRSSLPIEVVIP